MMNAALPPPDAPPARTDELWQAIDESVREACLLRAEGRAPEAAAILQQRLPQLIAPWSRGAGLPAGSCQQLLRELFSRVQQQVATATICKRLVLQSIEPRAVRQGGASASVHVHRRVPLGDIPGMLDALDEGARAAAFRQQNFRSTVVRPTLAAAG